MVFLPGWMSPESARTAILLVAHGSRNPEHARQAEVLRGLLEKRVEQDIHLAYLELNLPLLADRLSELASEFPSVCLLPLLLFDSGHAEWDLPRAVREARVLHPETEIRVARALGSDASLVGLARRRLESDLTEAGFPSDLLRRPTKDEGRLPKTACIYLAHGSRHAEANALLYQQARLFFEETRFATLQVGFLSLTQPSFCDALDAALRQGAERIAVVAHILFSGRILKKAKDILEEFGRRHPTIGFAMSKPLGADPTIAELLKTRFLEAVDGCIADLSVK